MCKLIGLILFLVMPGVGYWFYMTFKAQSVRRALHWYGSVSVFLLIFVILLSVLGWNPCFGGMVEHWEDILKGFGIGLLIGATLMIARINFFIDISDQGKVVNKREELNSWIFLMARLGFYFIASLEIFGNESLLCDTTSDSRELECYFVFVSVLIGDVFGSSAILLSWAQLWEHHNHRQLYV